MLNPDQTELVLRELIASSAAASRTALVEDRTGLLAQALPSGLDLIVAGHPWLVLPPGSILAVRRILWERRPERVALIAPSGRHPAGLRDLTEGAAFIAATGASMLKALVGLHVPEDPSLDALVEPLLARAGQQAAPGAQPVPRTRLPATVLSLLLGQDLREASPATALARTLLSGFPIPQAAHRFCREYAETLPDAYQRLVVGLLTFGQDRSGIALALLGAHLRRLEGQVPGDPLVAQFLDHAASNDAVVLDQFASRVEEAFLAEPEWGRSLVRGWHAPTVTHSSRILPAWLEADFRRQLDELVARKREAIDDRLWREHLFYPDYRAWHQALERLALLLQLETDMQRLLAEDCSLPDLAQAFADRISAGDLAWSELVPLAMQAVHLQSEVRQVRTAYQKARTNLNRRFAERYSVQYPNLFGAGDPPLVVHLLQKAIKPRLAAGERVLLLVVDGLGYPLWQRFRSDLISGGWQVKDAHALALLPTVTLVSRFALFSGPVAARIYPDLTEPDDDAPTNDEATALAAALLGYSHILFKKRDLRESLAAVTAAIQGNQYQFVAVVVNEVDDALRAPVNTPFALELASYPLLSAMLNAGRQSQRSILLVADHGSTSDANAHWPAPPGSAVVDSRLARASQLPTNLPAVRLESLVHHVGGPYLALYDFGGRFSPQPKVGYHSGISLEEVVVPAAWLQVGAPPAAARIALLDPPAEVTEDHQVLISVELGSAGLPAGAQLEIWLPDQPVQVFPAEIQPGQTFRRWQIAWTPSLPAREPAMPQTVLLRAVCRREGADVCHTQAQITILPRPGKYESAVAALLP